MFVFRDAAGGARTATAGVQPTDIVADPPSRAARREGMPKLPALDGMRAIAVLVVMIAHGGLERVIPGGFGVTIFFFLSGFLITTLLRVEGERGGGGG